MMMSWLTCSIYRHDAHQQEVKIALVGKYIKLEDAYISVIKALQHAALACRHHLSLIVSPSPIKYVTMTTEILLIVAMTTLFLVDRKLNQMIWKMDAMLMTQSSIMRLGSLSVLQSKYFVTFNFTMM